MNKILLFIVICANLYQVNANNTNKKETLFNKVSFLLPNNDSLYSEYYLEIDKLFKQEDYVKALEKALVFYDLSKESDNVFWSFKIVLIIGDIYNKTNKFNKSLEYL